MSQNAIIRQIKCLPRKQRETLNQIAANYRRYDPDTAQVLYSKRLVERKDGFYCLSNEVREALNKVREEAAK